jgi:hypothetical protein
MGNQQWRIQFPCDNSIWIEQFYTQRTCRRRNLLLCHKGFQQVRCSFDTLQHREYADRLSSRLACSTDDINKRRLREVGMDGAGRQLLANNRLPSVAALERRKLCGVG